MSAVEQGKGIFLRIALGKPGRVCYNYKNRLEDRESSLDDAGSIFQHGTLPFERTVKRHVKYGHRRN